MLLVLRSQTWGPGFLSSKIIILHYMHTILNINLPSMKLQERICCPRYYGGADFKEARAFRNYYTFRDFRTFPLQHEECRKRRFTSQSV